MATGFEEIKGCLGQSRRRTTAAVHTGLDRRRIRQGRRSGDSTARIARAHARLPSRTALPRYCRPPRHASQLAGPRDDRDVELVSVRVEVLIAADQCDEPIVCRYIVDGGTNINQRASIMTRSLSG